MFKKAVVPEATSPPSLPYSGKSRWRTLKPFSPVCQGTFLALSKIGKAPRAERLGKRCTFYDNEEFHRWLSNPADYMVDEE